eukprot:8185284-Pyramimonas_sp.AAC.1
MLDLQTPKEYTQMIAETDENKGKVPPQDVCHIMYIPFPSRLTHQPVGGHKSHNALQHAGRLGIYTDGSWVACEVIQALVEGKVPSVSPVAPRCVTLGRQHRPPAGQGPLDDL